MPGPEPTTIAILGSGAVGALIGAELTRAGVATTLITRDASAEAINARGITVTSPRFGDHVTKVAASTTLDEPIDVLLVAVKAPQLVDALKRVAATPGIVVPLLNGVDHVTVLRHRFGADRVIAGTVRVQAHREGSTKVVHRAPFLTVTLAQPGAPALEHALTQANIDVAEGASEADVLWAKLSRLAALALATTAADAPLGDVRETAEAVAREVTAVAIAEGATIDPDTIINELRGLPDTASSSLRADVTSGTPDHELDAIGGAVLRAARCHDLLAPQTAELVARVQRRATGG
jgi:2-dehydropantoate 2-reductase